MIGYCSVSYASRFGFRIQKYLESLLCSSNLTTHNTSPSILLSCCVQMFFLSYLTSTYVIHFLTDSHTFGKLEYSSTVALKLNPHPCYFWKPDPMHASFQMAVLVTIFSALFFLILASSML
jgi:hypothetical protein